MPHKKELGLGKGLVIDCAYDKLSNEVQEIELIFRKKGAYSKLIVSWKVWLKNDEYNMR